MNYITVCDNCHNALCPLGVMPCGESIETIKVKVNNLNLVPTRTAQSKPTTLKKSCADWEGRGKGIEY